MTDQSNYNLEKLIQSQVDHYFHLVTAYSKDIDNYTKKREEAFDGLRQAEKVMAQYKKLEGELENDKNQSD